MPILTNKGNVSNQQMETIVKEIYGKFDHKRKELEAKEADLEDIKSLEELEKKLRNKNKF